eukprot:GHVR01076955.1.p1 GENE.GHVR01076955.1~~GHVR01076955.1.p1  ORF type:complete len:473 (+),score=129.15 GHVR01076955.1:44-1462(+)
MVIECNIRIYALSLILTTHVSTSLPSFGGVSLSNIGSGDLFNKSGGSGDLFNKSGDLFNLSGGGLMNNINTGDLPSGLQTQGVENSVGNIGGMPMPTTGSLADGMMGDGMMGDVPFATNTAFALGMVGVQMTQKVPVSELIYGMDALRQSGLTKRRFGSDDNSVKKLSLPPPGTAKAVGQCYNPSRADDGVLLGGLTCCIPVTSLRNADEEPPRLGGVNNEFCEAALMSKGSRFDGHWCVTTQYSDPTCRLTKYQAGPGQVLFEGRLTHDEPMNNVVCRCMIEETEPGVYTTTTDVQYELSAQAVLNPETTERAQKGAMLGASSELINPDNLMMLQSVTNAVAGQANIPVANTQDIQVDESGNVITSESFEGNSEAVQKAQMAANVMAALYGQYQAGVIDPVMRNRQEEAQALSAQGIKAPAASGMTNVQGTPAGDYAAAIKTWNQLLKAAHTQNDLGAVIKEGAASVSAGL